MSTFTPGPWHAVDGSRGRLLICAREGDQDTALAECFARRMSSNGPYPVEANRRLMLAAPTMAEYVKKKADEGDSEALAIWEAIT